MATTLRVPQSRWDGKLTREFSASATGSIYFSTSKTLGITEGWFVIDPTNTNAEMMYLTNITGSAVEYTATVSVRGLREYGTDTNISGNQKPHRVSSRIIISDNHNWLQQIVTAFNNHEDLVNGFHGVAGIGTTASRPSASSNSGKVYFSTDDLIAYFSDGSVWNAQSAGTQPDAGATVKGVTKLTVAPVAPSNPIAVGDNDPRMISATNVTDLTDGGETTLHYHNSDRARANHTGTQPINTIVESGTAGETLAVDQLVYIKSSDGKLYKATNNITSDANSWNIRGIVITGGAINDTVTYRLLVGSISLSTPLIANTKYYLGTNGSLTSTAPSIISSTIIPFVIGTTDDSGILLCHPQRIAREITTEVNPTYSSPIYTDVTVNAGFTVGKVEAWILGSTPIADAISTVYGYYNVSSSNAVTQFVASSGDIGIITSTSSPFVVAYRNNASNNYMGATISGTSVIFRAYSGSSSSNIKAIVRITEIF